VTTDHVQVQEDIAALLKHAYQKGWDDAAAALRDNDRFHDWVGVDDREDLYGLLPGQRRAAAMYLGSTRPKGLTP
jgi:hypothetical protein